MPDPAEILYLAAGLGTGGTERHLSRLLPGLPADQFRPVVWNAGEEGESGEILRHAGIEVRSFTPPVSIRQVGRMVSLVRSLVGRRPALVHSYLYGRHWLDAVSCRLAGTPYVGSRRNLAHWRHGPVLAREKWRDRLSAAVVANSQAVAEVAAAEGVAPGRLVVIPNGVPLTAGGNGGGDRREMRVAARAALGLNADSRVVGSVTSLKAIKDPLTLLQAFARRRGLEPEDRLVLVGDGPLAPALGEEARRLGVGGQLVLAGRHPEPSRLMPALDLFALSSRTEGCSNAVLEAMAAGLPVAATDVGGNREAVAEGETGLLVPVGDAAALGSALDRLLTDRDLAATLGEAGRERVARRFSVRDMIQAHARLYRRLMAGGGPDDR